MGVVLSGGGATATAHVGFLKALEENNIPIDYITGSSMGAIIGAFYASGYSIEEIEKMVRSNDFLVMSQGILPDTLSFYLREDDLDASMVNLRFNPKSIRENTLPTHLIDPVYMDYRFIEFFSPASAAADYDFDQLFVPYRALASDIEKNESFVFRKGELNLAARASGTYPFYLEPLTIDSILFFDGGLYNNYPADVLYEEFLPDIILGCNVSQNEEAPKEGNLMSQLVNMIQYQTDFDKVCDEMITIEPVTDVTTFEFDRVGEAINAGYRATINNMDSIQVVVQKRVTPSEIEQKRKDFRSQFKPLLIKQIKVEGVPEIQQQAIINNILQKNTYISIEDFRKRFFRLYADYQVRYLYPTLEIDPLDGKYIATVNIKPEKKVEINFGGNFSSRPLNTGFLQARYHIRGRNNLSLLANSYFGKFYSSTKAGFKLDLNLKNPMIFEMNYTYNSWDYFTSFATFLEEVKPSFIVKNEQFVNAEISLPVANRGKLEFGSKYAHLFDDYYQTDNFLATDTTDQTNFNTFIFKARYERSTLNRKQFADDGTFFQLTANYLNGEERTIPGSTSQVRDTTNAIHNWAVFKGQYINYFFNRKRVNVGFHLESAWAANQPRFNNYRATLIRSLAFEPVPESRSFFIDQYRSNFYTSAGLMATLNVSDNVQFRAENYVYRPWERIFSTPEDESQFEPTSELFYVGSGSLVYHSPIGPLRVTLNYFDRKDVPWSLMFNFGYFIFNQGYLD
ncbi:MAG: patatin-like phospholipase family protein [Flavobacteriales bacterium]